MKVTYREYLLTLSEIARKLQKSHEIQSGENENWNYSKGLHDGYACAYQIVADTIDEYLEKGG